MAKKFKIEPEKQSEVAPVNAAGNGQKEIARPAKKPRTAAAKPKKKKPVAKEKAAKPTTPDESPKAPSAPAPAEPSDEAIRIRAYFIAERRHRLSLPGDSAHDWIEARRQLIEEAGRMSP